MKAESDVQEKTFVRHEADRYFRRMHDAMIDPGYRTLDPALFLIKKAGFKPKQVLEIGCSIGWRLDALHKLYNSQCLGIEPSREAIREGRKLYKNVEFRRGICKSLPIAQTKTFDLVIVYYVLHWISRESLFKSLAEIDRVVADGGHLILADFLPNGPTKVPYHHLPDQEIFTFKLDYAQLFKDTGLYREKRRVVYNHRTWAHATRLPPEIRGYCTVLQKSNGGFYKTQSLKKYPWLKPKK